MRWDSMLEVARLDYVLTKRAVKVRFAGEGINQPGVSTKVTRCVYLQRVATLAITAC